MSELKKSRLLHKFVEGMINSDVCREVEDKQSFKNNLLKIVNQNPDQENIFTAKRRNLRIMFFVILSCSIVLSFIVGVIFGFIFIVIGLVTYLYCAKSLFKQILSWFVEQIDNDIENSEKKINGILGFDLFTNGQRE